MTSLVFRPLSPHPLPREKVSGVQNVRQNLQYLAENATFASAPNRITAGLQINGYNLTTESRGVL